jgi:hypothetical protein
MFLNSDIGMSSLEVLEWYNELTDHINWNHICEQLPLLSHISLKAERQ